MNPEGGGFRMGNTCKPVADIKFLNYLIVFFAARDGEVLYSQQKYDWELTVAQIMNSLIPNSDFLRK